MEALGDGISAEVARIFTAKQERRQDLARLPYPEKVQAVIELQKLAATILRARGKIVKPWKCELSAASLRRHRGLKLWIDDFLPRNRWFTRS